MKQVNLTNNSITVINAVDTTLDYTIPRFDEFAELFHDRLHALTFHIAETKARFTIILTLLNRSQQAYRTNEIININTGTETQRRILEGFGDDYSKRNLVLDSHWESLKKIVIDRSMQNIETFKYVDDFNAGKLSLKSIKIGKLAEYFKNYHNKGIFDNEVQKHEYHILSPYFNTAANSEDAFISIPIAGFGTFDGVAHIIFTKKDIPVFKKRQTVKTLAKLMTLSFEDALLSWVVDLGDAQNIANMKVEVLKDAKHILENPFAQDLGLTRYYKYTGVYHQKRINSATELPLKLSDQYRLHAITTILIDSFAHNISAHSLTTLSAWFNELTAYAIDTNSLTEDAIKQNPIIQYYTKNYKPLQSLSLSREQGNLYKFLYEKAAFWNAISRQTNFAGQVMSLYDVLWKDFIGNPFYLGSIAYAEKVRRLDIGITFFEAEERDEKERYFSTKTIAKDAEGKTYNGILASIDLSQVDTNADAEKSFFVQNGADFERLSAELKKCQVFFPGGVVGKHAFLTILENEIRNIKHHKDDMDLMERIRKNGLRLNISIHKRAINTDVSTSTNKTELYKIGVSLQVPTKIEYTTLEERLHNLEGNIINEEYRPRLGGTFQDKICAAMLFKGSFAKVQNQKEAVDERYYPWVKSAVQPVYVNEENIPRIDVVDFELSLRTYKSIEENFPAIFDKFIADETHKEAYEPDKVYYKKYIHLWLGEEVYYVTANESLEWENIARFKIVILLPQSHHRYDEMKHLGITRILKAEGRFTSTLEAYHAWLQVWNKGNCCQVVDVYEGHDNIARITYHNNQLTFVNRSEIKAIEDNYEAFVHYVEQSKKGLLELRIAHGGKSSSKENIINYRSHGALVQRFTKNIPLKEAHIDGIDLCELYEVLLTRIAIFDNRLHQTLSSNKRNTYNNKLLCNIQAEEESAWQTLRQEGFEKLHYLVVHLAFIEKMKDSDGQFYGEKGIPRFIEEQILGSKRIENLQDHFTLVITTGRGRIEWWDKLAEKEQKMVNICTFRPLESLMNAIQDAKLINDDLDLKYHLVKVLMNS